MFYKNMAQIDLKRIHVLLISIIQYVVVDRIYRTIPQPFFCFLWCYLIERSDSNFDNNELDRERICKDSNFVLLVTKCQ